MVMATQRERELQMSTNVSSVNIHAKAHHTFSQKDTARLSHFEFKRPYLQFVTARCVQGFHSEFKSASTACRLPLAWTSRFTAS